ncbi:hypothetical protein [Oleiagrimonas sp. MCCC 1A03011]|uniref:hypothetical protein n=1 Tax=Oleiagrimonas sp. MCCC 1A03011 TaxID=1926883 RepID=UPI000DC33A75|nr:hypothetical protein [Oleiagrimonas sp. MCCC 1A03011]RAP59187.1 hypothetical protein BTJ49_00390 [Oleiagrimonas sp. MCCC 1A03011]
MNARSTHPDIVDARTPLSERFFRSPLYPLRNAALPTLVALSIAHILTDLLPGLVSFAAGQVVWASIILYAMESLRRTADGYADPPEITMYGDYAPAITMLVLQKLGYTALYIALMPHPMAWLVLLAFIVLLPVIATALAFEDSLLGALHPARWGRAIYVFGPAYLLPVFVGLLEYLSYIGYIVAGSWLGHALWFTLVIYLCLLQFHLLGVLIHKHHEELGHQPDADVLSAASGRNEDDDLLRDVAELIADNEHGTAESLLRDRLRERHPTASLFEAHRDLLRQRGDRDALLRYAQSHLALLLNEDQVRPALRLATECIHLDPNFMPDQPESAARLADAAAAQGMTQLALKLARGYPNRWPRDGRAPYYGLLAARLLAERMDQVAEAGVLANKLLQAFGDRPERAEIEAFLHAHDLHPNRGGATA